MQEKLKELELLVSQLLARQKDVQGENFALKQRLRTLEDSVDKLKNTEAEVRALREWKKNAQTVLRRLATKLDKEIAKTEEEESKIV
ncbi:MAG: hypothetical protein IKP06_07085 [Elusimicrobiaceae bacterium]|nr:hypothetical protein [Elusimicrobiaceae bacterium]